MAVFIQAWQWAVPVREAEQLSGGFCMDPGTADVGLSYQELDGIAGDIRCCMKDLQGVGSKASCISLSCLFTHVPSPINIFPAAPSSRIAQHKILSSWYRTTWWQQVPQPTPWVIWPSVSRHSTHGSALQLLGQRPVFRVLPPATCPRRTPKLPPNLKLLSSPSPFPDYMPVSPRIQLQSYYLFPVFL